MRVLLALESAEIFYHYKSVIAALCRAGHPVKVFFAKGTAVPMRPANSLEVVEEFAKKFRNFEYVKERYEPDFLRRKILFPIRAIANYRRFLKMTDKPPFYKDRYRKLLPLWLKPLVFLKFFNLDFFIKSDLCGTILASIEKSAPPDKKIIANINSFKPDVVLVSSGNVISSSPDFEYVRAARFLGIRNALLAASWDYLETKGLIHIIPDVLLVWNDTHMVEAVRSHGIPSDKIRIVGAPLFDNFFSNIKPSDSRLEFCRQYGLRPEQPIILYIGSSGIFGDETRFLKSIRQAIDNSSDERIRKTQIIVRPHPISRSGRNFKKITAGIDNLVLIPEFGELPSTNKSLQVFYDTLYHSVAVVSIASSGFLNALIVDKPAVTVLVDYYRQIQSEAPHFKHLIESRAIEAAKDFSGVPRFLKNILAGVDEAKEQRNLFIRKYIRPRGLQFSAGEAVAKEIENLSHT